jgi:hypothetical protein
MQTWIVHMREPLRLLRDLGPGGFVAFQLVRNQKECRHEDAASRRPTGPET